MDRAPCVVTSPRGQTYAPVRALVEPMYVDGESQRLNLLTKAGESLLLLYPVDRITEGRRHATVYTPDGAWSVRDLCGCNAQYKAWKREWDEG